MAVWNALSFPRILGKLRHDAVWQSSHSTTALPPATGVPDEEHSIERRTRRGGRERGEREERREGLCSIGYSFRYAHYYIIL